VQAGTPVMTVVSLKDLWVDANFKESQLQGLRIGQPAELEADVYGTKVVYHGKVVGLGAGTGAAFALLPAQNATGNWIKVVQRVPVRISLDAKELAEHPLRVGLSMNVTVDTADQSGKLLSDQPHPAGVRHRRLQRPGPGRRRAGQATDRRQPGPRTGPCGRTGLPSRPLSAPSIPGDGLP
jgi:multidrug resistance efflux pump